MESERIQCGIMTESDIGMVKSLEEQIFTDAWTEQSLKDTCGQPYAICLTAKVQEEVAGYILCYQTADECEILRIAVEESRQRSGIGKLLYDRLYRICQEKRLARILLDVRESNEKAQRFYQKQGFVVDGLRPGFYRAPKEAAVLMSCLVRNDE